MTSSELKAKHAEIKQAYRAELSSKACDLKAVWKGMQDSWGADRLQELHRLLYRLVGSGATFYFQGLSTHPRVCDSELNALQHAENRYV